jgi:hypothetical protein
MPLCILTGRMAGVQGVAFHQGTGTGHAGFLVGSGKDHDRFLQFPRIYPAQRLDGQRQEGLHVGGAEAVEAAVRLGQAEGVVLPAVLVPGHGVGVAGEHQPTRATAEGGDEVRPRRRAGKRHDLDLEAGGIQPAGKQVDHGAVALVETGGDAAHRGGADQRRDHVQQIGWVLSHADAGVCRFQLLAYRLAASYVQAAEG